MAVIRNAAYIFLAPLAPLLGASAHLQQHRFDRSLEADTGGPHAAGRVAVMVDGRSGSARVVRPVLEPSTGSEAGGAEAVPASASRSRLMRQGHEGRRARGTVAAPPGRNATLATAAERDLVATTAADAQLPDFEADWKVRHECCGRFACAKEGGDCCCRGSVRLGKFHGANGVSHWTQWRPEVSNHWATCVSAELGEGDYGPEDGKYCECEGYCPVTCAVPTVLPANMNMTVPCKENQTRWFEGEVCSPQCVEGFMPTMNELRCRLSRHAPGEHEWTPYNFSCVGVPCPAPSGINNAAAPACAEGSHVTHGSTCAARCARGYMPSANVLSCDFGHLEPTTFHCDPMGCEFKAGHVENEHPNGPCAEGSRIASGGKCTTRCKEGYTPSVNALDCALGEMSPATFECVKAACAVPTPPHSDDIPCEEHWSSSTSTSIPSGKTCTPRCEPGYLVQGPSLLHCEKGVLTPNSFSCVEEGCPAPANITNAAQACEEGTRVPHGNASCTAHCDEGYEPTLEALDCHEGQLYPPAFACRPATCTLPPVANAAELPCGESAGDVSEGLASGGFCDPSCLQGYVPIVPGGSARLSCELGRLTPETFNCSEQGCAAPSQVEHAAATTCQEGPFIEHGQECHPNCLEGYTPSVDALQCHQGDLSDTFTCTEEACVYSTEHLDTSGACGGNATLMGDAYVIGPGDSCAPKCDSPYIPNASVVSCARGNLTPALHCRMPLQCSASAADLVRQSPTEVTSPCLEGASIDHGGSCTADCGHGYTADVVSLSCHDGAFSPPNFACVPNSQLGAAARCLAPVGTQYVRSPPCHEMQMSFAQGESCTVRCISGFSATPRWLRCVNGSFPDVRCDPN